MAMKLLRETLEYRMVECKGVVRGDRSRDNGVLCKQNKQSGHLTSLRCRFQRLLSTEGR